MKARTPTPAEYAAHFHIPELKNQYYLDCFKSGRKARLNAVSGQAVPHYSHDKTRQSIFTKGWNSITDVDFTITEPNSRSRRMDQKELIKAASTVAEVATEALTETKPWYQSRTIIGGGVTIAAAIGGAFGLHIDPTTQQGLVAAILYLTGGIGGVISIIGRILAEHKVGR